MGDVSLRFFFNFVSFDNSLNSKQTCRNLETLILEQWNAFYESPT